MKHRPFNGKILLSKKWTKTQKILPYIIHSVLSFSLIDSIVISIKFKTWMRDQMILLEKKKMKGC